MIVSGSLIFFAFIALFILSGIKILNEYERGVVFFLGRVTGCRGPGIIYVIPGIEKMFRIDLRTVTMDVPQQDAITRDNVTIKVNAVVYFRVLDPNKAIIGVENYLYATSQLAQTTLRSVLGQADLDELLSSRDAINHKLQTILDLNTEPWGVKVSAVEVKQIDLPIEMQRAMAKQAEAEREKRAKIISAQAEYEAATKLAEASDLLSKNPVSLQLRYLQTMVQMSNEKTTNTIIPFPMDILRPFMKFMESDKK